MPKPEPTLEDIAAAKEASGGSHPSAVLNAFLPRTKTILGNRLLPVMAGHELLLAQIAHPLSVAGPMADSDVLMALFIFSMPSRELFQMISDDTFESEFFAFLDSIPASDIEKLGEEMVAHWISGRVTALAMESKHPGAQKKTAASGGS